MEAVGLALGIGGLASILSALVDVSDRVIAFRRYDAESRHLIAQFEADKRHFLAWTQQVGIINESLAPDHDPKLDDIELATTVSHVLCSIYQLLKDVNSKLASITSSGDGEDPEHRSSVEIVRTAALRSPSAPSRLQLRQRLAWIANGKSRFKEMVDLFAAQVDRLYNLVPPPDNSIDRYDDMVRRFDDLSTNLASLTQSQSSSFNAYSQDLAELLKQSQAYDGERLEAWIDATNTVDLYHDRLKDRTENTCAWIYHRDAYRIWSSQENSKGCPNVFWLHAPPGFGKSVLCASIIEHLKTQNSGKTVYFFCTAGIELCRKPLSIIRSWIMQAIRQNKTVASIAFRLMEASEQRTASTSNIWKLFEGIVEHDFDMTFVVDGFDECMHSESTYGGYDYISRSSILERIHQTIGNTGHRLLVVSRDESDIRSALSLVNSTTMCDTVIEYALTKDDVQSDVHVFSRKVVNEKLCRKDGVLKEDLANDIAENCQGMFLWIKLQGAQLRGTQTSNQLRRVVKDMPLGLENAYMRDWQRIMALPTDEREKALALLRWITFSARPMTVLELIEALLVTVDEECTDLSIGDLPDIVDQEYINEELLRLGGSLLELHSTDNLQSPGHQTVTLVHFSVRAFLLSMLNPERTVTRESTEDDVLARCCLRYLEFGSTWDETHVSTNELAGHPFKLYATVAWFLHVDPDGLHHENIDDLVRSFFIPGNPYWQRWRNMYEILLEKSDLEWLPGGACYYASFFDLLPILKSLLLQGLVDVNESGGEFGSALQAACVKGLLHIIQYLLTHGADINLKGGAFGCAINAAAFYGHLDVVSLLLRSNVDLTITDNEGYTALSHAAMEGHLPVVRLLVAAGADCSKTSKKGYTALFAAARYNRTGVVEFLLENGANHSTKAESDWTALSLAAAMGYADIVRILLQHRADYTIRHSQGWTALQLAADGRFTETVQILLEQGATSDKMTADGRGWTPLLSAASKGNTAVVRLLLDSGADIEDCSDEKSTALSLGARYGRYEVVKMLLERGANLASTDSLGWTPLFQAVYHSHTDIVKLFIEKGADFRSIDNLKQSTVHIAAMQADVSILRLFLGYDLEFDESDANGYTPLIRAVLCARLDNVRILIEHGASTRTVKRFRSVLSHELTATNGNAEMVHTIMSHGADIDVHDDYFRNALHVACWNNDADMVSLLLSCGATYERSPLATVASRGNIETAKVLLNEDGDSKQRPENLTMPLILAVNGGHSDMAKLLLNHGYKPDMRGEDGETALIRAVYSSSLDIVQLLINEGANVNALAICDSVSPLYVAIMLGKVEIAKVLIASGADVNQAKRGMWTPLHTAIYNGKTVPARLLFENGADPNICNLAGWGPLHTAAFEEDLETLSLMLPDSPNTVVNPSRKPIIDIAARTEEGQTALHIAAIYKKTDAIRWLIDHGADPSLLDGFGRSCFDWAYQSDPCLIAMGSSKDRYIATPQSVSRPIIIATLAKLIRSNLSHIQNVEAALASTGKILLLLGDRNLAAEAYTWQITRRKDGTPDFHAICDNCDSEMRSQEMTRYACTVCGDSDLCGSCYDRSRKEGTGVCAQHEMLKVTPCGWQDKSPEERKVGIRQFLLKVQEEYLD